MKIELDRSRAIAGELFSGRVIDRKGEPVATELWLERRESNGSMTFPASGVEFEHTTSDPSDGRFTIPIPLDAMPTVKGIRAGIDWMVVAKGKTLSLFGDGMVRVEVDNPRPPVPPADVLATAGSDPPRVRRQVGEHIMAMVMGLAFFAMFAAFAIYAWFGESEEPTPRAVPIIAFAVACIPLTAAFLAARTVWPRRPRTLELEIAPVIAHPGDAITVRHLSGRLTPVRFLCVESYLVVHSGDNHFNQSAFNGSGGRVNTSQFHTMEARRRDVHFDDSGTVTIEIPLDAAPSFTGKHTQIRWVIRAGGDKILRWGPISLREWHIVVVDERVDAAALRRSLDAELHTGT